MLYSKINKSFGDSSSHVTILCILLCVHSIYLHFLFRLHVIVVVGCVFYEIMDSSMSNVDFVDFW